MRALDLFCGAGGASMGYHMAGFEVVGVDHKPQPRYPFTFHQADALTFPLDGFDLIHASPPCQRYSRVTGDDNRHRHSDLIAPTRERLAGHRHIIENVLDAKRHLVSPVMLCGLWFGLGVVRHRLFESNMDLVAPEHTHHSGVVDGVRVFTVTGASGGKLDRRNRKTPIPPGSLAQWKTAMDIDWMRVRELVQAIPPAYTWYLGDQAAVGVS